MFDIQLIRSFIRWTIMFIVISREVKSHFQFGTDAQHVHHISLSLVGSFVRYARHFSESVSPTYMKFGTQMFSICAKFHL